MTIYQFKPGSHIKGDPQTIGERLSALEESGRLTPEVVVADARQPDSVLHGQFEWNDKKAAHKWRIEQAGHIIRCVTVVVESGTPDERVIRAFVPIDGDHDARSYVPTLRALGNTDMRKQVIAQAYAELGAVARKYRELKELGDVLAAIDRVGELLHEDEGQPS